MIFLYVKPNELEFTKTLQITLGRDIISVGRLRDDGTHLITVLQKGDTNEL